MRIERELMRGAGPVAVLKLLHRGEMYGYQLVEALSQRSDGVLAMGQSTLYPLLYNLEAKGLVEAAWREAESGRDRKYYRLTDKGRKRLAADIRQWQALAEAMANLGILDPARLAPGATA
ncbi:MAG: helix-turn-helix transcriptional regulator [Phycisphaeraceae bacterium]|nr:helix-turn-helix transcriptional regulator [Phycisphaeraceae bacterium]